MMTKYNVGIHLTDLVRLTFLGNIILGWIGERGLAVNESTNHVAVFVRRGKNI